MSDNINVDFDDKGRMVIECDSETFVLFRDFAFNRAAFSESEQFLVEDITTIIEIIDRSRFKQPELPPPDIRDRLYMIGCATMMVTVSGILLAGIYQIVSWINS